MSDIRSTWCWVGPFCAEIRAPVPAQGHRHLWTTKQDDEVVCACGELGVVTGNFFHVGPLKRAWIRALVAMRTWPLVGSLATWAARRIKVRYYFDRRNPPNLGWGGIEVFEVI